MRVRLRVSSLAYPKTSLIQVLGRIGTPAGALAHYGPGDARGSGVGWRPLTLERPLRCTVSRGRGIAPPLRLRHFLLAWSCHVPSALVPVLGGPNPFVVGRPQASPGNIKPPSF